MTALLVVLVALSVYRLTRLITADQVLEGPRRWVHRRNRDSLSYFITCPWCVSVWVSVPVAWIGLVHRDRLPAQVAGLALSASAAAGILSSVVPE